MFGLRREARGQRWRIEGGIRESQAPSPLVPCPAPASNGFTMLEMMLVMFLLVAVLGIVIPQVNLGDNLVSTGRKLIGALRTLQGIAMSSQKPVKLYLDIDRNTYWAMTLEGNQEKPLLDASWAAPRSLPDSIRFADIAAGPVKRQSGRIDLMLYPNGRIDPAILHLTDTGNNTLGIAIESTTGAIRTSDERIEPQRPQTIPDRVKTLLTPATTVAAGGRVGTARP